MNFLEFKKEIEKTKKRAISITCTYTPPEAKIRIDAYLLIKICDLALRAKPGKYKLKRREDGHS
jgi:hypothetical protein